MRKTIRVRSTAKVRMRVRGTSQQVARAKRDFDREMRRLQQQIRRLR